MLSKKGVMYRLLCMSWVLITMFPGKMVVLVLLRLSSDHCEA